MKKILSLIIIGLISLSSTNSNANTLILKSHFSHLKPPVIHINFIVAKPRTDCTMFPGVCKMEFGGSVVRYSGLNVGGNATLENNILTIDFLSSEMDATMKSRLSQLGTFTIDEVYVIPMSTCEKLLAPKQIAIPVGRYPIKITNSGFQITIPVN